MAANLPSELSGLPTYFDSATCVRRGLCPVTTLRKGSQGAEISESHSLYYEQHGNGTRYKLIFIMGLNASACGWGYQIERWGKSKDHSVLIFDNRGVGNSGYPNGPYTTSGMAEDVITLLNYVEWTGNRDVHIIGVSLGGMIAQELAYRIPERIASLVLAVTTPGGRLWNNFPPWAGVKALTSFFLIQEPDKRVQLVLEMLFNTSWLDERAEKDPKGRTNREIQTENYVHRVEITKPQLIYGHFAQMAAGLTHHVSPARLAFISKAIPKVVIVTGDEDTLVLPTHSLELKMAMPEAEFVQWKRTAHALHMHRPDWFNDLIDRAYREGMEMASRKQQ